MTTLYDAATTPSWILSVQHLPHLSTHAAAGSKHPAISEGDLPLSKILKTLRLWQKVTKESGDLKEELDFALFTNITRSDQVLIITCLCLEHLSKLCHSCMSFYTLWFTWLTYLWPCAPPCGLVHTFHHILNSSTFHRVVLLCN